jgi:hypothetical protein
MPYQIDRYALGTLTTVDDGTVDQTTNLKLVGRNYAGYGEIQNENFVHLLENFASANAPTRPLSGQIWFDSASNKLKFYDGVKFRTTGGAEIGTAQPAGLTTGDFWWDTANNQLYAYNGTTFTLVGPQGVGSTITSISSRTIRDTLSASRPVIEGKVDNKTVFFISDAAFTILTADRPTGFSQIKQGFTLRGADVNTGAQSAVSNATLDKFWGTAANSDRLNGLEASAFVQVGSVDFDDSGYTLGTGNDLEVKIVNDNEVSMINNVGPVIKMGAKPAAGVPTHSVSVTGTGINPAITNQFDLGTLSLTFKDVHATNFMGLATHATHIKLASTSYAGATTATNNTVALRDGSANITAANFLGIASQAKYADLAEKYLADENHPIGTVMSIGGTKEIQKATQGSIVVGVVSGAPAYLMNAELQGGTAVGIKGRVPVLVTGTVTKGDKIGVSNTAGIGIKVTEGDYFAVALETDSRSGVSLVECYIK